MGATAVIPARYASVRFPGKVLADRTGQPLVRHVYERVRAARLVDRVIVAADDPRIAEAVRRFGGEAVMTSTRHPNGTCRVAEVAANLASELVVNVQADEPEIEPEAIDRAIRALTDRPDCVASTLAAPFTDEEDPADPNIVKVVLDGSSRALYFSRALVPYGCHGLPGEAGPAVSHSTAVPLRGKAVAPLPLKHVGMYVYRREFLPVYVGLAPTPLEQAERLEQLRILEHGYAIAVAIVNARWHGIDTAEQYEAFVARVRS